MLDKTAVALALVVIIFLAIVINAPFFHAAVAGALLLAIWGWFSGKRELYVIAAFLPPLTIINALGNALVVRLTPHPIDSLLLATDFGISRAVYLWFDVHPLAFAVIHAVYYWLPIWAAVVLCVTEDAKRAAISMALAPLAALPFFLLLPACGPVWIHTATAPRNCVPSLHMTWVFLLWYYSPKWLKPVAVLITAVTALATLGLGEHYVIDLVVAVPFTLLICKVVGRVRRPEVFTARSRQLLHY